MKKIFPILLLILSFGNIFAQNPNKGNPIIQNYLPADYGASSQNWSIVQDSRGVMYFGNTQTLLEFDGTRWQKFPLPDGKPPRSLDINPKGELFVGTENDFGFLAITPNGDREYVSLAKKLPDSLQLTGTIWRTIAVSSGTYFFSPNKIFCYGNGKTTVIDAELDAMFGFKAYDQVLVLQKNKGLFALQDNKLIKLPDTEILDQTRRMFTLIEFRDNKILIGTRSDGFFTYDLSPYKVGEKFDFTKKVSGNLITHLQSDATSYINKNSMYSASKVSDNMFAFGTIAGGIVVVDENGQTIRTITTNNGLNNNCVYALHTDMSGNIWAGLQQGIARIDLSYPLNSFNYEFNGIAGYTISSKKLGEDFFVSTMTGLYQYPENDTIISKEKFSFKQISTEVGEYWSFTEYNKKLLIGGGTGILVKEGENIRKLIEAPIRKIQTSKYHENILFASETERFTIYKIENNSLELIAVWDKIKETVEVILEKNETEIWLSTEFNGIYKVEFNSENPENSKVEHFTVENGLPSNSHNYPYLVNNEVVIATENGLFKISKKETETNFEYWHAMKSDKNDTTGIAQIIPYKNKFLVNSQEERVGFLQIKDDGSFEWDNLFSKRFPSVYRVKPEGEILHIYTSSGLFTFDLETEKNFKQEFNTLIRKVYLKNDSLIFMGNNYQKNNLLDSFFTTVTLTQNEKPVFDYKHNSLSFEYSATFFEDHNKTTYQYMLKGFDDDWSNPTRETKAVFTNIPEGKYTFMVKATNVYGTESEVAGYSFTVKPPYYRTIWAYLIYFGFFILLMILFARIYTQRLKAKNKELENLVIARTAKVTQQKEEIQTQAEELFRANEELEKLSIVASETDNAVLIMDKNANIEWINHGFSRMYGYTLEEFKQFGQIYNVSSDKNLKEKIFEAIEKKQSLIYESKTLTKEGENVYAQTTITPIFSEDELVKIIAIDSDISKLKNAEKEITEQKEQLENKNRQISDSIRYAKTIQRAMLPSEELIKQFFDSFIIFRPKDIVSGDFYWATEVENQGKKAVIIAAVDCTGHGVPGAFMSMIGMNILNNIVKANKIYEPKEIISCLDSEIQNALNQATSDNHDGMDLSVIYAEPQENEMKVIFGGAKSSVILFDRNNEKATKIKGARRSVGGIKSSRNNSEFDSQSFVMKKNDILYLFSDGYADQNNKERKRLGTKTLLEKIEQIAQFDMLGQKLMLEKMLSNWQGNEEQRDDILLMGLKF